jgi:hypothetical protein
VERSKSVIVEREEARTDRDKRCQVIVFGKVELGQDNPTQKKKAQK